MEHEVFVTHEQAVILKELGFDWECIYWYRIKGGHNLGLTSMYDTHNTSEKGISAPTLSQVQKWLREVKGIEVNACFDNLEEKWYWFANDFKNIPEMAEVSDSNFDTYEQALSAGIDAALELLK